MLDSAAYTDLRGYIKRRISYARYRIGETYHKSNLNDIAVLANGTVRVQLSITVEGTATINRVELHNAEGSLWAHQDCNITISAGQTGALYWFDFAVTEEEV